MYVTYALLIGKTDIKHIKHHIYALKSFEFRMQTHQNEFVSNHIFIIISFRTNLRTHEVPFFIFLFKYLLCR